MAKKVTVQAAEWHTHEGKAYDVGDTYQVDEEYVDSLRVQRKAFATAPKPKVKAAENQLETKDLSAADAPEKARKAARKMRGPRKAKAEKAEKAPKAEKSDKADKSK